MSNQESRLRFKNRRDKVLGGLFDVVWRTPQVYDFPTVRYQAIAFFGITFLVAWGGMPVSTVDFNSKFDGRNGDINVEDVKCELWNVLYVVLKQHLYNESFAFCWLFGLLIMGGAFQEVFARFSGTTSGEVGFACELFAFFGWLVAIPFFHASRMVVSRAMKIEVRQRLVDLCSVDLSAFADCFDVRFFLKQLDEGLFGWKTSCSSKFGLNAFAQVWMV